MSNTPPPDSNAAHVPEDLSPDGRWRVVYDSVDGEKSPRIVSPRVIEVSTGRVVVDLWQTALDGTVSDFAGAQFTVTVRDPYGPTTITVLVDVADASFVLAEESRASRPLGELRPLLSSVVQSGQQAARTAASPPHKPATSRGGRG